MTPLDFLPNKISPHESINLADSNENPGWNLIIKYENLNEKYYPCNRTREYSLFICINYTTFSKKKCSFIIFAKSEQNNHDCKFFKIEKSLVIRIISV